MHTVHLPIYQGPLDLLLHLIEKQELDITRISLAAVTNEYLSTIREMDQAEPDQIAEFLVVAAKLLLIKSQLLLPTERVEEAEEDDGEDLARALQLYVQFKGVAAGLAEREAGGLRSYPRTVPPPEPSRRLAPQGLSVDDVLGALERILREQEPEPENVDEVVRPLRITVRQRIDELTAQLRSGRPLPFPELLSKEPNRQEVIATFLAVLELLKLGWVRVHQYELWGGIEIAPVPDALPDGQSEDAASEVDEYI
jgi:segregation and condensation protein A